MPVCYYSPLVCKSMIFSLPVMPLSANSVPRKRKYTRSIRFEGCARADGPRDFEADASEVKPAGHPRALLPDHHIAI